MGTDLATVHIHDAARAIGRMDRKNHATIEVFVTAVRTEEIQRFQPGADFTPRLLVFGGQFQAQRPIA